MSTDIAVTTLDVATENLRASVPNQVSQWNEKLEMDSALFGAWARSIMLGYSDDGQSMARDFEPCLELLVIDPPNWEPV